jgi:hypothetical protein
VQDFGSVNFYHYLFKGIGVLLRHGNSGRRPLRYINLWKSLRSASSACYYQIEIAADTERERSLTLYIAKPDERNKINLDKELQLIFTESRR